MATTKKKTPKIRRAHRGEKLKSSRRMLYMTTAVGEQLDAAAARARLPFSLWAVRILEGAAAGEVRT